MSRNASVTRAVAAITSMSLAELRCEWERRYGAAPRHRSADLLRRVLAWRVQADVYGGLDAATKKLLAREDLPLRVVPPPGMRLAREWAGRTHEVVMVESGVVYEGKTWGSLSEIARHITGMRWNGPRFFGLRQANVR
ncbi:DUF2924 domain-containing protein [Sphingopyxis terrae]|uniref:DUF2924 domain-containing protein n=1 Tax=Sphingopyxis terrae TaxID=33052 RepID=UPI003F81BBF9